MDPHTKALLKEAAQGLEDALRLAGHGLPPYVTLEYMTPQARMRQQADEMDYQEQKMKELVDLCNRLREATR